MTRLFVYGTLAPGQPNAHVLEGIPGEWEPAVVAGALLPQGWGAALGYPGIVLGGGGMVAGLLFSSAELVEHWPRLDEFEGSEYERVRTPAHTAAGLTLEAWIYAVRP